MFNLPLNNKDKVILHLCSGNGSDSQFYKDAGYTVIRIGIDEDVRLQCKRERVYGIIANPPCTHLAGSGARWWEGKGIKRLFQALALVDACCRVVLINNPKFWVIENPVGRLTKYLGKPIAYYHPYEFGDPYTKKTCLWGKFNMPIKNPVLPTMGSMMHLLPPSRDRANKRSICPQGFAKAFFESNR